MTKKDIMKRIFGSLAALVVAVLGLLFAIGTSGCTALPQDETPGPAGMNAPAPQMGEIDLASIRHAVEAKVETAANGDQTGNEPSAETRTGSAQTPQTRAVSAEELQDYDVKIVSLGPWYVGEEHTFKISQCNGTKKLWAGDYSVTVTSPQVALPAFEIPTYKGTLDRLTITTGGVTAIQQPIVCRQSNVKVTVNYSERLRMAISSGAVTVWPLGDASSQLPYSLTESRGGYFAVNPTGTTTLRVQFQGYISGSNETHSKDIRVTSGEWARVYFSLEQDESFHIMVMGSDSDAGQIDNGAAWF